MLINDKLSLLNSSALSGYKKKMAARNYIQERPTQIRILLYCTLWEECKQTQCPHRSSRESSKALMWYYSPTKNKLIYQDILMICGFLVNMENTIAIYSYSTPWTLFPQKWCVAPELCWSPPTAVLRFDASDMAVPGLYISLPMGS